MIRFKPSTTMTRYFSDTPPEISILEKFLEIATDEKDEDGNEIVHRLYSPDGEFLTGLLPAVIRHLTNEGVEVDCPDIEKGEMVTVPADILEGISLRDMQIKCVQKAIYHKRGLINAATSAGKTEIYAAILKHLDLPSIAVLGRVKHARQLYQRLILRGVKDVAFIDSSASDVAKHNVIVSNSALNGIRKGSPLVELLSDVSILCFDETHHLGSASSWQMIGSYCKAEYRLGLSATCLECPSDPYSNLFDMSMIGILGSIIVDVPLSYLIKKGYVINPSVYYVPVPGKKISAQVKYYKVIYDKCIVRNPYRNYLISALAYNLVQDSQSRILIIVERYEHGQILLELLHDLGVAAMFSAGGDRVAHYASEGVEWVVDREEEYMVHFLRGDFQILIGTTIYDESVDIPELTDTIMAAAGRKSRRMMQRLGRGVRISEGKMSFTMWDMFDTSHWMLKHQSNHRRKTFESEGLVCKEILPEGVLGYHEWEANHR